jgi:hypothetical protein
LPSVVDALPAIPVGEGSDEKSKNLKKLEKVQVRREVRPVFLDDGKKKYMEEEYYVLEP